MSTDSELVQALSSSGGELFRQLLDSAPDALIILGEQGSIELVNQQAERLFGYQRDELVGQRIEMLIPERFRTAHLGHRAGFAHSPKVRVMGSGLELFGLHKNGQEFSVEISLSPLTTERGTLVLSAIRDVSARKRSEQKFRALLESAPDAMVIADRSGRIVLLNAQAERIFGYRREELLGKSVDVLVPKRLGAQHRLHREGYARTPKPRTMGGGMELFGLRKDGTEFPAEISLSPLETEEGTWISSAIRDVSERRRVEKAARLASDRLLSAVESIQGMLALWDAEDHMVLCNSACRELLGRSSAGAVVGCSFVDLLQDALKAGLFELEGQTDQEFLDRWLAYHRSPFGTLDVKTRAGQHLRVTDRRTLEGGIVTILLDITDDAQHEAALTQARAQAESASAAKSEFLASMSHELRTPLNAILGFAQLLQRDKKAPLNDRQLERVDHVLKGGEHLLRLIDDILDLSRIEAGRVTVSSEPVGVREVLGEVRATLAPMAARFGVELQLEAPPDPTLQVIADRTRFSQILINFGSNAIKYNRAGGTATFKVLTLPSGALRIAVSDNGIGIPLAKQSRIFQPFQRAGQEAGPIEGTGIGLAICKRLAELMSGSIDFESAPERGSEFWLDLPVHVAPSVAREQDPVPAALGSLSTPDGPRYLVVYIEDNPSNIAFMRDVLGEFERINLLSVPTAEVGIEVVREQQPDLVIMDINLPGMSGFEATRILQQWPETAHIPVIALTAAAMTGDRARASNAGFRRYLTKPVKVDELLQTLQELLPAQLSVP
jgi:PAS domain S-box-containing protein